MEFRRAECMPGRFSEECSEKYRVALRVVRLVSFLGVVLGLSGAAAAQRGRVAGLEGWDHGDLVNRRASEDPSGTRGNDDSELGGNQAISGDGRYVVFRSYATNFVSGDTNRVPDIFVHDRLTGDVARVSVSSDGRQANGFSHTSCISANGRYVAFGSEATNLVPGDTNRAPDTFVHDRLTGETTRVSVDSSGGQANGFSGRPALSADGRYVVFKSLANNLVPGDTNDRMDVFVHDRQTGETTRVSVSSDGTEGDQGSGEEWGPAISADGRYVAFPSWATNLVPGDTNGAEDVFVHDRATGETTRVSVSSDGSEARNGASWYPSLSADGRYVTFLSGATNLVSSDTNGYNYDIFVHDRLTGETTLVSVTSDGRQGDYHSRDPSISADGRFVTFVSQNDLSPDTIAGYNIYVHDRLKGETTCASVSYSGIQTGDQMWGNFYPSISADGRYVAFDGYGQQIVPGDPDPFYDVFVRGPELTLDAEPAAVHAGETLHLTVYKSQPGHAASLWAVRLDGTPGLALVAEGIFADDGNFVVSATMPPELSGKTVTFRGYGIGHGNDLVQTNDVSVSFQ